VLRGGDAPDRGPAETDRVAIPLATVIGLFLRLGATAFGGPAAHIAMFHHEFVRRRSWLTDDEFGELLALTNLIPGPNSTEMAIHIGRRIAGWGGFLVAGICFILPAAVLVWILAVLYVHYGHTPDARAVMAGVTPVMLAVIAHAAITIGRSTLRGPLAWGIAAAAAGLAAAGVNEIVLLLAAGVSTIAARRAGLVTMVAAGSTLLGAQAALPAATAVPLTGLSLFFLKVGSVLFGSGYVLVAFLRADLVERWRWLTDQQLMDAIAAGQMTPGPVFTTATFIGYVLHGTSGALLATVAIFLPAFVFVALTQPVIPRLRASPAATAFLNGVIAASIGLIAAVAVLLVPAVLTTTAQTAGAVAALLILLRWRLNPSWLLVAGAILGWLCS
jgi:chromate transporter